MSVQAKFQKAVKTITSGLIDRADEVEMVFVAMVCGEHPLLVGLPGTAKSMLLDSIVITSPHPFD